MGPRRSNRWIQPVGGCATADKTSLTDPRDWSAVYKQLAGGRTSTLVGRRDRSVKKEQPEVWGGLQVSVAGSSGCVYSCF